MRTISFVNIKGGVGKTTTAMAFALILSREMGKRVLVIDATIQHHMTRWLGITEQEPLVTLADIMLRRELPIKSAIYRSACGVDLIPSSFALSSANRTILIDASSPAQFRLKMKIAAVADRYDYCIIDCPPDVDVAVANALAITDEVLIPVDCSDFSMDGMEYLFQAMNAAAEYNPNLKFPGVFLTMDVKNSTLAADMRRVLEEEGVPCFQQTIRHAVGVKKSTRTAPVILSQPQAAVCGDFRGLVKEYLDYVKEL